MEALKNPKKQKKEERDERIREKYKHLIGIGSDSTASARHISEKEGCGIQTVWKVLGEAGLTGRNKIAITTESTTHQTA